MERVEIKSNRLKLFLLTLGSIAFVCGGVGMWRTGGDAFTRGMGMAAILFFGACGISISRYLLDPRPRIVFDEFGVTDVTLQVGRIAWNDIEGAGLVSMSNNKFIMLRLSNPEEYLAKLSKFRRGLARANRGIGFENLNLNLTGLATPPDEIMRIFSHFVTRYKTNAHSEELDFENSLNF